MVTKLKIIFFWLNKNNLIENQNNGKVSPKRVGSNTSDYTTKLMTLQQGRHKYRTNKQTNNNNREQKQNDSKTPKNNTNTTENTRLDDNLNDAKNNKNYRFLVQ